MERGSFYSGEGRGMEAMGHETSEFLIIAGGDGDNTGVYPPAPPDRGDSGHGTAEESEKLPEGAQFPGRFDGHCTD